MASKTFRYDFIDGGGGSSNVRRSIRTGSTWRKKLTILQDDQVTPENISTWTFAMEIRPTPESDTVIIELTSGNGRIVFVTDGTDGQIYLLLTDTDTAGLLNNIGTKAYDIKYQISAGDVQDLFEGNIEILASPTR